jgi:ATP-dependent DNA helicase RecG
VGLREALTFLHHPTPDVALSTLEDHSHPAWQRLKAEELLAQQLSQHQSRRERDRCARRCCAPSRKMARCLHEQLLAVLPFASPPPSAAWAKKSPPTWPAAVPMHRLLQGDVGSGKTVVAALAACLAIDAGWQCALMAPTEILAEQHFAKLIGWLEPLLAASAASVAWLVGSQKKKERTAMLALVASGEAALVVGTHAVIQEQVQFKNLALAIIDEQHRFGVAQRLACAQKLRKSATGGAGRSVGACGRYGAAHADDERHAHPAHAGHELLRRPGCVHHRRAAARAHAHRHQAGRRQPQGRGDRAHRRPGGAGRQVYWVCPLIEESEALDLSNATATHADLSEALPGVMVGLLHSRMPTAEKKAVMALFTSGQMGVLVSTTVIEVGVDVPNASLMVIEHAERFGLSQLHQLRGRVGRGAAASACVLLYSTNDSGRVGETAKERLRAMAETNDGFEIARRDLEIRGPGEFLGARQSGDALLRFADLATDTHLLEWARELAPQMLDRHPELAAKHVARWLGGKSDYLKA